MRTVLDLLLIFHRVEQATVSADEHGQYDDNLRRVREDRAERGGDVGIAGGEAIRSKGRDDVEDDFDHGDVVVDGRDLRRFEAARRER